MNKRSNESIRHEARFLARAWHRLNYPQASQEDATLYADSEWRRYVHLVGLPRKELTALLKPQ